MVASELQLAPTTTSALLVADSRPPRFERRLSPPRPADAVEVATAARGAQPERRPLVGDAYAPPGPPMDRQPARTHAASAHAALWLGALLVAAGELPDPFPPPIEELARAYFQLYSPEVKA